MQRWYNQTTVDELLRFGHAYSTAERAALSVLHQTLKYKSKIVNRDGRAHAGIDWESQSRIIDILDRLDLAFANERELLLATSIVSISDLFFVVIA